MTWNVRHASSVASGRWSNSWGELRGIFCEDFRGSFAGVPFSRGDALSLADFASSAGDVLGAREPVLELESLGVDESLASSLFFALGPLGFGRSSSLDDSTAAPEDRSGPSMASGTCAQSAGPRDENREV